MSLDIWFTFPINTGNETKNITVFDANITHNLNKMAMEAGLYFPLWHKESCDKNESSEKYYKLEKAQDLIPFLENGINSMERHPDVFKKFDSSNGWGVYDYFLPWLKELLNACKEYPLSDIQVSI